MLIFKLRAFTKDFNKYYDAEVAVNLAIMHTLEKESIEQLKVSLTTEAGKY